MSERVSQHHRIALLYAAFGIVAASGISLSVLVPLIVATVMANSQEDGVGREPLANGANPVRAITTVHGFDFATSRGQIVLFVDGYWNVEVAISPMQFADFAKWCRDETDLQPISVLLPTNPQDPLEARIWKLWRDNGICPGGMKNHGGAGRLVWFNDGRVVDSAWGTEIKDLAEMKARTQAAFQVVGVGST